ncbi:MAG: PKD domain-containing protein, partial [Bacteroidota bacterium]
VGVMVEEYRNGVLLSRIRRDFQYNVGECGVIESTIVAPSAQCDNLTVHFENETDVTNNFIWYFQYPATIPTSTLAEPFYTFPGVGTYTVALIAAPGTQCVDTSFHTIFLQNNSLNANFGLQIYECTNESVLVLQDLSTDNISPPVQWNWTVSYGNTVLTSTLQNPVFEVPNPSTGTIKLVVKSQNGCIQEKTLVFNAANGVNPFDVLPSQVNVCLGSTAQLNPNGIGSPFVYQWSAPVPANQQNAISPAVSPTVNTTYSVTISVNIPGYGVLCQGSGTVTALVAPLPVLNFVADPDCNAKVVHFINQSQNVPLGYKWDFGDPNTTVDMSTLPNPTYVYLNYGTYTVTLQTAAANVCQATKTQTFTISEKTLQAAFNFDYTNCDEDAVTIQFFDQSVNNQNNTEEWEWEFSGAFVGSSGLQNPSITVTNEGQLNVSLTITTDENCVSSTPATGNTLLIQLPDLPGVNDGGSVLGCINGGVTLNPGGNPNYLYNWSPATGLSCTNCPSPFANPSQTTTYTVNVQHLTADTCDFSKSVTVTVPTNVGLVASNDVTTCNPTATLTANTILSPVTLTWTNSAGQQVGAGTSVTVPVSGYETYTVKAVDQFGCP